jgi:hypothetical protein
MTEEAHARREDPETSHEAAASVTPESISIQKRNIISTLRKLQLASDRQIIRAYHRDFGKRVSEQSIRSRRNELTKAGLIEWSGKFQTPPSGRRERLWRLK